MNVQKQEKRKFLNYKWWIVDVVCSYFNMNIIHDFVTFFYFLLISLLFEYECCNFIVELLSWRTERMCGR